MKAGCVFGSAIRCMVMPGFGRLLAGGDVDVVEDLEVIREELQRHDEDLGDPLRARNPGKRSLTSGVSHSSGCVAGALVREAPAFVIETQRESRPPWLCRAAG